MRETLQDIHADSASRMEAEAGFKPLRSWMMHSRSEPMKALARQFRRHRDDILAYFDHPYTNAILEGPAASSNTSRPAHEASGTWTASPP